MGVAAVDERYGVDASCGDEDEGNGCVVLLECHGGGLGGGAGGVDVVDENEPFPGDVVGGPEFGW